MSTHYLVSHFSNEISGVVGTVGPNPQTLITGSYVVRVPDDVSVQNPTSLADLLTKKYAGILGNSGLFTQIIYDDMLDESGVDTASSTGVCLGKNGTVGIYPTSSGHTPVLQTTPYNITWGGSGSGPVQAVLTYELFEYVDVDEANSHFVRYYKEVPTDVDVTAQISFDGGLNFIPAPDKSFISIPGGYTGTSVVLKFTRVTDISSRGRVMLGSWAVLF